MSGQVHRTNVVASEITLFTNATVIAGTSFYTMVPTSSCMCINYFSMYIRIFIRWHNQQVEQLSRLLAYLLYSDWRFCVFHPNDVQSQKLKRQRAFRLAEAMTRNYPCYQS